MNRMRFFMRIFRFGALVLLLSLSAYLLLRTENDEKDCKEFNACKACTSKQSCEQPQAIKFRANEDGE